MSRLTYMTYYHYFGARYYDSDNSLWLSVDPLADKYPSLSSYMYAEGNPVMMVDPNGMATIARKQVKQDWFMNEKTGDVYYNSELKKGDEGKGLMQGDNWVHMGKNGMFNNSSEGGSDIEVNSQNKDLQTDYHSGKSSNNEAYYNGDNAENLMDRMGYKLVPNRVLVEKNIRETTYRTGRNHITQRTGKIKIIGLTGQYVKDDHVKIRSKNTEYSHLDVSKNIITGVRKESEIYTENYIYGPKDVFYKLGKILKFGEALNGKHDHVNKRSYNLFD